MNSYAGAEGGRGNVADAAIRDEQVLLLYGSPAIPLAHLVVVAIVATLLWPLYPPSIIIGWIGLFVVVVAARLVLLRGFRRRQPIGPDAMRWGRRSALAIAATGCLWGLLGSVVYMSDDPAYYTLVAFVLGGMTAGAAMRDSAYLPAFLGFACAAIVPMAAALLLKGGPAFVGMGLMLLTYAAVLVFVGRDNHLRSAEIIRMRLEQIGLNDDLRRVTSDLTNEVAQREKMFVALEDSSARFRAIGDYAQDAIVIGDAQGQVIYWNPAAERIFGYTAGEMMGHNFHEVLTPESHRAKAIAGYARFAATGQGDVLGKTVSIHALRKNGAPFAIELSISAVSLGGAWHAVGIARDVSERERTLAELRERETELHQAQRVAHVGSWAWLPETDAVEWSDEVHRIFGRDPGTPAPSLSEQTAIIAPESYAQLQTVLNACRITGAAFELDLQIVRPCDAQGWISVHGEAVRETDGRITRIRGTAHDISERKRIEEHTHEQEMTFRGLVENNISGIAIALEDATVAYINPRFAQMMGHDNATALNGRAVMDFIAEPDWPAVRDAMHGLFSGTQATAEVAVKLLRKHGGTVDALVHGTLATYHGKRAVIAVAFDITERKQAEDKIAELNRQLTTTVSMLRRHDREQSTIARLSDLLQSCRTRTEAYPIIAAAAVKLFPATTGLLALVASSAPDFEPVAQWGADQAPAPFAVDDCWALRTGRRYEVDDPHRGAACRHVNSSQRGPTACLPLTVRGVTDGLLHLALAPEGVVDDELRQVMLSFGDVVKLALSNIKLRETLGEQAVRDQLTGLFNRHYLAATLPREISRARRGGSPLSVAMLDIDHFRDFNNTYGHDAGDAVLKDLGELLRGALRAGDIACRYGGEEFVLVMPNCDVTGAHARLRQICAEASQKPRTFRGQVLPRVTLSVGLMQMRGTDASGDALITAADAALYAAKHNGRDRIEIFANEPEPTPSAATA